MRNMSVKFEDSVILELKKISSIFNISYSDFIRDAVKKAIEEKQSDFMYRMSNVPYASEEEEKDIIMELSKVSNEDLKIVKTERIKLWVK